MTVSRRKSNTVKPSKINTTALHQTNTIKEDNEKMIDTSKPHWILRIVSDADKAV